MFNVFNTPVEKEVRKIKKHRQEMDEIKKEVLEGFQLVKQQHRQVLHEKEREERKLHLLEDMTNSLSAMMWRKDENGALLYANRMMCSKFLGLPDHCTYEVEGQMVEELLEVYIARTGLRHTFKDIVGITDFVVSKECNRNKGHRFIEFGWIGDESVLLYVTKSPVFGDKGDFKGTVGIALDASKRCQEILSKMEEQCDEGSVIKLKDGVYWLLDGDDDCLLLPGCYP